jgi:signal transduction histidine kinase
LNWRICTVNVVLLSTSKERIEAIRTASRRKGLACIVAQDEREAAISTGESSEGILVVDAESTGDLNGILKNRSPGWPILVLAARFDSSAWVELFKAGASEVVSDPLDSRKVDTAFDRFLRKRPRPSAVDTIWHALARRLGLPDLKRQLGFPILMGTRWVLLAGFGGLLFLLATLGIYSIVVLDKVERADQEETRRFIAHAGWVNTLLDRLTVAARGTRDYLLNRDRSQLSTRRGTLARDWNQVDAALKICRLGALPGQIADFDRIETQLAVVSRVVETTFRWDEEELDKRGYEALSKEIDPSRTQILTALDQIRRFDENHLNTAFMLSTEEIARLRGRLRGTIAIAVALGLGLAAFSIWQVIRLEGIAQSRYQALTAAHDEQGRLAQRVIEVQEQERKSLSRELHDEVSQSLGAMLVDLGNVNEPNPHLDSAKQKGNEVLNSIRNMCLLLRPSMLDDLGLLAALHWQARETLRRSGISVSITAEGAATDDADMKLPDAYRTTVYRVVQEALQNVIRHSEAKQAQIVIRREQDRLAVIVQDDGKGFDPAVTRGLGLIGMEERVHRLDGVLQINSEPDKGTIVSLSLPLPAAESGEVGTAVA